MAKPLFKSKRKKLGDMLLEAGLITQEQLSEALIIQRFSGKKIGEILINQEAVTQRDINQILESQLGIPHIELDNYDIQREATEKISENLAKRHDLIPIKIEHDTLVVAMNDPLNIFAIDDVRIFSGMDVQPVISSSDKIKHAIDVYYGSHEAMKAAEEYKKEYGITGDDTAESAEEEKLADIVNSAPIVKLVNSIIEQAVRTRASDIHIEPFKKVIRIRYRIDGQLEEVMRHDIQLLPAVVTRIKISADMNIAEKRRPQDGRISTVVDRSEYDLRISTIPTIYGEKVVIRITDKGDFIKSAEQLGFSKDDLTKFNNILKSPYGMILVTGPTGSGKSTTLYTALRQLNDDSTNIITVEDPVETTIEGINQIQVNPKAGLNFSSALRSILRQDPNVIMVGEIRDTETAEISIRAAVTGHLVLSTLHTNDAPSTIARLLDMNIEPFLIGTSVTGIIAQRLVRKICPKCKEEYSPLESDLEILGLSNKEGILLNRGHGCSSCSETGYQGRTAIYEIMPISYSIRQLINQGKSADIVREQAIKEGMNTLKKSCANLVLDGITTIEELVRVAYSGD